MPFEMLRRLRFGNGAARCRRCARWHHARQTEAYHETKHRVPFSGAERIGETTDFEKFASIIPIYSIAVLTRLYRRSVLLRLCAVDFVLPEPIANARVCDAFLCGS